MGLKDTPSPSNLMLFIQSVRRFWGPCEPRHTQGLCSTLRNWPQQRGSSFKHPCLPRGDSVSSASYVLPSFLVFSPPHPAHFGHVRPWQCAQASYRTETKGKPWWLFLGPPWVGNLNRPAGRLSTLWIPKGAGMFRKSGETSGRLSVLYEGFGCKATSQYVGF